MIFGRSDLPHIGWSLAGLLLASGMGGAAVLYGNHCAGQAERGLRAAQHRLDEARRRFAAASADHENMGRYAHEYGALIGRNVVGEERRLDWIEDIERIGRQNRLSDFSYAIAPQQAYTPSAPLRDSHFDLGTSNMSMHFGLLHEGQLLNFLDALRNDATGRFVLEQCAIERGDAQLRAECSGGWMTLKKRDAK